MKTINISVAAIFLAIGMANAGPTPGEIELNKVAIQAQRKVLVEMNMKMDDPTAKIFWPIYNDYIEAMQKPNDRETSLLDDYAANWLELSQDKAKSLLDTFFSVQEEHLKVKKSFVKKFSKSLPPKVVARFFQIDNKLDCIVAAELAQKVPLVH